MIQFSFVAFIVLTISCICFGGVKVSKEALKKFDQTFVDSESSTCQGQSSATAKGFRDWLISEIKKITGAEPIVGTSSKTEWNEELSSFKIAGIDVEGQWEPNTPGTFGEVENKKLEFANDKDGRTLKADSVDVDQGSQTDLQNRTDLENKIWLVRESNLIPSILALSLEAKLHKAVGLIIYGKKNLKPFDEGVAALPVVRVGDAAAQSIKTKLKKGEVPVEISLRTDYPINKKEECLYIKKGDRNLSFSLAADLQDCKSVGLLLGIMDWQKKTETPVKGTIFSFVSHDSEQLLSGVITELKIDPKSFDANKTLTSWLKSELDLAEFIDGGKVVKQTLAEVSNFQGLVDKDALSQCTDQLKKLSGVVKVNPEVAFQLKRIYEADDMTTLALDLKNLREVHKFAQRGQWEKAVSQFQKIHDYDWAQNISTPTFLAYKKKLGSPESVDPALWIELQSGRNHLDGFIENVEAEIDRLDKKFSDNFFKFHKSIENLDKI